RAWVEPVDQPAPRPDGTEQFQIGDRDPEYRGGDGGFADALRGCGAGQFQGHAQAFGQRAQPQVLFERAQRVGEGFGQWAGPEDRPGDAAVQGGDRPGLQQPYGTAGVDRPFDVL